jgi:monoamine oxidase
MTQTDILIIGAGAAGLMAAQKLAKAGKKVTVLEARDRCGGRIHTIDKESFFKHVELGAEFIHGDLPVTLNLLKEAGISYHPATAEMWHYQNGRLNKEEVFIEEWDVLTDRLNKLKYDTSIEAFMEKQFRGKKYDSLKSSVRKFVSGYDTADPAKASAFALRKEWESDDGDANYRINGGYGAIIKYLEQECKASGGLINLNSSVNDIHWQAGAAKAVTTDGTVYEAKQIIIALPLGVLQADRDEKGAVTFHPAIPEQGTAINAMGYGAVIKILLEFKDAFWTDRISEELANESLKNMGFLFSEEVPTWWTQVPQSSKVLTGWIGGPAAAEKKNIPELEILRLSLQSLAKIFNRDIDNLRNKLIAFSVANWTTEPYTRGSYAYDTIAAPQARKVLNMPVDNTLFFAGEYLYEGNIMGTVEAALTSGLEVAGKIMNGNRH